MRTRRVLVAALAVLGLSSWGPAPAKAGTGAVAVVGFMDSSGMFVPGSPNTGTWGIESDITAGVHNNNLVPLPPPGYFEGAGNFTGYCGLANGFGWMSLNGETENVTWILWGTTMMITGGYIGVLELAPSTGTCVFTAAKRFAFAGAVAHAL